MKKNNIVDYFQLNLLRLKVWINRNNQETEEISRIMFNNIVDSFPDANWFKIKDTYASLITEQSPQWIINYTIITYKLGLDKIDSYFLLDLCTILTNYAIAPYNLSKIAAFFLSPPMYDTITNALATKGIPPRFIIKLILDNFNLTHIDNKTRRKIYDFTKEFIEKYDYQIFSGNYNFFNIYRSLKRIWDFYLIMELPELNYQDIELLLELESIPNPQIKSRIKHDFATIEKKDCSIAEKFQDCLTVIAHYAYDLPNYAPTKKDLQEKRQKK